MHRAFLAGAHCNQSIYDMQSGDEPSTSGGTTELTLDDLEELGIIGSGSSGVAKKVRNRHTGQCAES